MFINFDEAALFSRVEGMEIVAMNWEREAMLGRAKIIDELSRHVSMEQIMRWHGSEQMVRDAKQEFGKRLLGLIKQMRKVIEEEDDFAVNLKTETQRVEYLWKEMEVYALRDAGNMDPHRASEAAFAKAGMQIYSSIRECRRAIADDTRTLDSWADRAMAKWNGPDETVDVVDAETGQIYAENVRMRPAQVWALSNGWEVEKIETDTVDGEETTSLYIMPNTDGKACLMRRDAEATLSRHR